MFRPNWTILKERMLSLAKAKILWNWSVKVHRYMIRYAALWQQVFQAVMCVLCAVLCATAPAELELHANYAACRFTVKFASDTMYLSRNIEARNHNHCYRERTITTKYYDCVSVFLPCLSRIHSSCSVLRIYICGLPSPTIVSTLSHKRNDFRKKVIEHKVCWSTTLFVIFSF